MAPTQEQLLAAFKSHPQLFTPINPQQQEDEGGPETLFGDGLYELIAIGETTYRYDKETVNDAIATQKTRSDPKFSQFNLVQLYESLDTWEKAEPSQGVQNLLANSINQLRTEIQHRESAIAELIEQRMIIHCPQWLINARTTADGFGRPARASLEESLIYVAQMRYEPEARCHVSENVGNHPEHQADFLCTWRSSSEPSSKVLSMAGIFLFFNSDGKAHWRVC